MSKHGAMRNVDVSVVVTVCMTTNPLAWLTTSLALVHWIVLVTSSSTIPSFWIAIIRTIRDIHHQRGFGSWARATIFLFGMAPITCRCSSNCVAHLVSGALFLFALRQQWNRDLGSQFCSLLSREMVYPPHDGLTTVSFSSNNLKVFVPLCQTIHLCPVFHVVCKGFQLRGPLVIGLFINGHQLITPVRGDVTHEFLQSLGCPFIACFDICIPLPQMSIQNLAHTGLIIPFVLFRGNFGFCPFQIGLIGSIGTRQRSQDNRQF